MPRTFVVTGANRGIGLEYVRQLLARGERVIATAREPEKAVELRALETDRLEILPLDVTSRESVDAFAGALGGRAVDVLINNAGTASPWGQGLEEVDLDEMRRDFEVNALGPVRVTRALLPALRKSAHPVIAHTTSKMGSIADNTSGGSYGYRMSKAALNMFNKSLSQDPAVRGAICVVLHPGWVQTRMGGAQAPTPPEESVRGLLQVLDSLTPEHDGKFLDFRGREIPW